MSKPNVGILATKDWVISLINKVIKKGFNGYSTDEKRIGTWIDGKPLYRCVIQFTAFIPGAKVWTTVADVSNFNIKKLIHSETLCVQSTSSLGCGYTQVLNGNLQIYPMEPMSTDGIIIEYTKTTD